MSLQACRRLDVLYGCLRQFCGHSFPVDTEVEIKTKLKKESFVQYINEISCFIHYCITRKPLIWVVFQTDNKTQALLSPREVTKGVN